MLVSSEDKDLARKYDVKFFPSLGLFRNGNFVKYSGDLLDEFEVLDWLTARETLEIPGTGFINQTNKGFGKKYIYYNTFVYYSFASSKIDNVCR